MSEPYATPAIYACAADHLQGAPPCPFCAVLRRLNALEAALQKHHHKIHQIETWCHDCGLPR